MSLRDILPSKEFSGIVLSIAFSLLLVVVANAVTQPPILPAQVATTADTPTRTDWQATLDNIQAQQANRLPTPPDPETVQSLLHNAQTANVTDSIGRSLLINVTDASAQGLGADQPTQDQLVAAAMQQIQNISAQSKQYSIADLKVVADSKDAVHTYGNGLALALSKHPHASVGETLTILGSQINGQSTDLAQLGIIAKEYEALASDLAAVPVPVSLAQYHMQAINDDETMAASFAHMETISSDPMRGLAGLKIFNDTAQDEQGVFISIAQVFAKDGILFTKDDPGALLSSL